MESRSKKMRGKWNLKIPQKVLVLKNVKLCEVSFATLSFYMKKN
jgi:hypothetical protein